MMSDRRSKHRYVSHLTLTISSSRRMTLELDTTLKCENIALEEQLDSTDPLRHLRDDGDLEGVISSEGLARASSSISELLTVLPQQSQSVEDGLLKLTFAHSWDSIPRPLSISLVVDASPGCGGLAWPAGQILASYLVQKGPQHVKNKNIIELGSGTGLVGLTIGTFASSVCITDQSPLLPVMNRNVLLNKLEETVHVAELNWGDPIPPNISRPDIILAADCVYFEPAFPLLADKRFFGLLKKKFTWKEVKDDPNRQIYNREAITLVQLYKLR
ncbi:hypothetical protein BDN70DRAFT_991519 [Pholiota conissans]|uniref:Elongation factor methyltransferase 6 n=1 Tax=Pholiota conissans TaxID=109636 RepID=A0A9P6D3W3_9AGAR|nr:hypothetical protein BDN70DRAFT_991519 [Pholiota conissans]